MSILKNEHWQSKNEHWNFQQMNTAFIKISIKEKKISLYMAGIEPMTSTSASKHFPIEPLAIWYCFSLWMQFSIYLLCLVQDLEILLTKSSDAQMHYKSHWTKC